ncbi:MAG: hypothetical protein KGL48_13045 [Sphingomonadales bacterium]|nr:hypothetical protein [Sphingomonadales bacterium]MDE2570171.1 hypothetical protein [Sphingomonadales bacterium]
MKIGVSRPFADPGAPINDIDMGEIGRLAEQTGFDWLTSGHHTVRPLREEIKGPHTHGVPFYQDPLIGAARDGTYLQARSIDRRADHADEASDRCRQAGRFDRCL